MTNSMTGFGSSQVQYNNIDIDIDLKTINNKYLDMSIIMPRDYDFLEETIQKNIKEYISRGKVIAKINMKISKESSLEVDIERAKNLYTALNEIKEGLYLKEDITLSDLLQDKHILKDTEVETDREVLSEVLEEGLRTALLSLDQSRAAEGENLEKDLLNRINEFEAYLKLIEERKTIVLEENKQKLMNRLDSICDIDREYMDNRLAAEILLYTEKSDITEEIIRLNSHLDLFRKTIKSNGVIGKKLDFICQEFLREANTISSKSNDFIITNEVINIKTLIDQIREQVQNIE